MGKSPSFPTCALFTQFNFLAVFEFQIGLELTM